MDKLDKMKFPQYLKVGGHKYKIIFPYSFRETSDLLGQCDRVLNEIRLSQRDGGGAILSNTVILNSYIHELLHAADDTCGARIFSNQEGEQALRGISQILTQMIIDNPKIFDVFKNNG